MFSTKSLFAILPLAATLSGLCYDYSPPLSRIISQELTFFIEAKHSLPRYTEEYYSPLGRSPVVDAILADPFYLPSYARLVGKQLIQASQNNRLFEVYNTVLRAGGVPLQNQNCISSDGHTCPQPFLDVFGEGIGQEIYFLWQTFIHIYHEAESALKDLTPKEKQWILDNREAFFFGKQGNTRYQFLTTNSEMPLKFFEMSARVDLVKLAECAQELCLIVDRVYQQRHVFKSIDQDFIWKEQHLTFIAAGTANESQKQSADFFLDLGGRHIHYHNAGGTEGKRAAALFIDLVGNHQFIGQDFVQGSGFLGVGVLANFGGKNTYQAKSYSQGVGFFGAGILMNLAGGNTYELDFFGQSCAAFGSSLLWDKKGNDRYLAREGMAQAASSTLGVAFLLNNEGDNTYISGGSASGMNRNSGMGQGGSIGVRHGSWMGHPSFYGGVSFLYDVIGSNDTFWTPWLGQGSSHFLGLGILMVGPGDAEFRTTVNGQGQGLHLSAGLLLKEGGNDYYSGGWGSLGTAGDRSVGMFIDTGGNDIIQGTGHSVGSARKPNALGVFIKILGNADYSFKEYSNVNIQRPRNPEEWPSALFLDLNGINRYPEGVDHLKRCNGCRWNVGDHGIGIDVKLDPEDLVEAVFDQFPKNPRIDFPFDPINGWADNVAYRPLKALTSEKDIQDLIKEIPQVGYDQRRQIYETLDLWRFTHENAKIDTSELLIDPASAYEDQLNYAFLWGVLDEHPAHLQNVMNALNQQTISSEYARKMALRFIALLGGKKALSTLATVMETDPAEENRVRAALWLAKIPTQQSLKFLEPALKSCSERIRYAAAAGLKDSPLDGALQAIIPLLEDPSFYVRRAAALTAISLHYKPAIPVLLNTLHIDTLDTTDNYGDNLYNKLAGYVGINLGLDRKAWLQWWQHVKDTFEFPAGSKEEAIPSAA